MKVRETILKTLFLLLLAVGVGYGVYYMYYTGKIVILTDHGGEHITLGLDGGGDGISDLTNDYYGVDESELQDLRNAKRDNKSVTIKYHRVSATDPRLILDSVQVRSGKDITDHGELMEYGPEFIWE